MEISTSTKTYIAAVRQFSGSQLKREDDCALLAEAASAGDRDAELSELCFTAKFLHKTFALMTRIGPLGEGYDKLAAEFESNIGAAVTLLARIAEAMPAEDRLRFTKMYLALSGPALDSMMELVHDLAWMKNYSIDAKGQT
ncbi:MAG TPA: hypothetical protein VK470_04245 [Bacteroidota bacterium]|nr:hypothetical protein [Bacteroidota bacterium]